MWDLIVSVPDNCLSFYFSFANSTKLQLVNSALLSLAYLETMSNWSLIY